MTIDKSLGNLEDKTEMSRWHMWLNEFDNTILNVAHTRSEEWFKKQLKPEILEEFYKPTVQKSKNEKYPPTFKMKIPVKDEKADVTIYNDKEEEVGQELIEKGCHVRTIVELQGVWFVNKMFGVTWKVLQLQVFPLVKFTGFAFKKNITHEPKAEEQDPPSPDPEVYEPYVASDNSDNE